MRGGKEAIAPGDAIGKNLSQRLVPYINPNDICRKPSK
jgi:hypothetical protein